MATTTDKPDTLKGLRERLGELKNEAKDLIDKKGRKDSDWSESNQETFNSLVEQANEVQQDIKNLNALGSITDWQDAGGDGASLINHATPGEKLAREIQFRSNAGVNQYANVDLSRFNPVLAHEAYDAAVQNALSQGKTGDALIQSVYNAAQNSRLLPRRRHARRHC